MNNNESEINETGRGSSELLRTVAMTAAAAALSALALPTQLYLFLMAAAAGVFACMFITLKHPALSLLAPAAAFGAVYAVERNLVTAGVGAGFILACGLVIVFCKKKHLGFLASCALVGALYLIFSAALIAVTVKAEYGNLAEGIPAYAKDIYDTIFKFMKENAASYAGITIPDNIIKESLSFTATLLPGIAVFVSGIVGAAAFFITRLVFRIFAGRGANEKINFKVPTSAVIFFMISFVIGLLFSVSEATVVPCRAAINMCLILAFPTLCDGIGKLFDPTRRPKVLIQTPNGIIEKRKPSVLLIVLVVSVFFSIIYPIIILLVYSSVTTIKDLIKNSKRENGN